MTLLNKALFDDYVKMPMDKLEDLCIELEDDVADKEPEHPCYKSTCMSYNCAVAAKYYKKSKHSVRTIEKGTSGTMYKFDDFVECCEFGKLSTGIGFYADTIFNYTDIPVKPIHILSDCYRTDFKYVIWFDYEERLSDAVNTFEEEVNNFIIDQYDGLPYSPTMFNNTMLNDKRNELCSIFCNNAKQGEPADLKDINDFDMFVKRFWNLNWNSDTLSYN